MMVERKRGGFIDLVCVWRMFSDETFFFPFRLFLSVPKLAPLTVSDSCSWGAESRGCNNCGGGRDALPEITIILYLPKSLNVKLHSLGKILFATESAWSSFFLQGSKPKSTMYLSYRHILSARQAL